MNRFSFPENFGSGVGNGGKSSVLSFAELMQCVGVHNFQHSWDSALDSYPLAAHYALPVPVRKESDKVTLCNYVHRVNHFHLCTGLNSAVVLYLLFITLLNLGS